MLVDLSHKGGIVDKYKNISNSVLHLDCMTHTIHLEPGETATLPATRDVRYYSGIKQLIVVRDKMNKPVPLAGFKPKQVKKQKSTKRVDLIQETKNEMENT